MPVCKCVVSISAFVVLQPLYGNVSAAPCLGKTKPRFICSEKLFPGNPVIDALDNRLNPTLKHIGPVIQQYFEASAGLHDGNLCAPKDGR